MRAITIGLAKGAVFIGAVLAAASGAWAAGGDIVPVVTTITPNVTYSSLDNGKIKGQTTQAIYFVTVESISGNTINNVVFEGTTTVTDPNEAADYLGADFLGTVGPTCAIATPASTAPANARTVTCNLGQFRALGKVSFYLFFKAPLQFNKTSPVVPDNISFSGRVLHAEGVNGGNSFNNSIESWTAANVLLGTPSDTSVKSGSPKTGSTFFTGLGGVPGALPGDQFATTIGVPSSAQITTTNVLEEPTGTLAAGSCTYFNQCYASTVYVKDVATDATALFTVTNYLTVILRVDSANIPKANRNISTLNALTVKYYPDPLDLTTWVTLGDCASGPTPRADGIPCIAKRVYYRNKGVTGWTADLDQDFEVQAISLKNGRFGID